MSIFYCSGLFVNDDKENNVLIFLVKEYHAAKGNGSFVLIPAICFTVLDYDKIGKML